MIIDDYAYITILKSIGGKEREEKVKLKHIKNVKIKDGFLIIRAMREDVYYTEKKNRDSIENIEFTRMYHKKQNYQKISIGTNEEEIFKNWRFDIRKIKELELWEKTKKNAMQLLTKSQMKL